MKKILAIALALTLIMTGMTIRAFAEGEIETESENDGVGVAQVSCGLYHTGILKKDGSLWMTGSNGNGEFGDGTTESKKYPAKVATDVAQVSCGSGYTGFIKKDGTLWMTGSNGFGQFGDGTTESKKYPVKVANDVIQVSCGLCHTGVLKKDGSLWMTGRNACGQLGNGTTENKSTPVKVAEDVIQVSCGGSHTGFLKRDGSLWMAGSNGFGQLGDRTTENKFVPVKVAEDVVQVSCGACHTGFVKSNGNLLMMGMHRGQLGIYGGMTRDYIESPTLTMDKVAFVSCGNGHTGIIKMDGVLCMTGSNGRGQLGDETTNSKRTPVEIEKNVGTVCCGMDDNTGFIKKDGSLWMTGYNSVGQLGDGTTEQRITPVMIFNRHGTNDVCPAFPKLEENDARAFLGFIYNTGDYKTADFSNDPYYALITGDYSEFESAEDIELNSIAFSTFVRDSMNKQCGDSNMRVQASSEKLIAYLKKQINGKTIDDGIVTSYVSKVKKQLSNELVDLMSGVISSHTSVKITQSQLEDIELAISGYSQLTAIPGKVQQFLDNVMALINTCDYLINTDINGRSLYFNSYLSNRKNYSSPDDIIFQTTMDYNFLAAQENSSLAGVANAVLWIDGKDSWNNHRETIDRWAEFLFQIESISACHDYKYHSEGATCTESGTMRAECVNCGEEHEVDDPQPLGHLWNNGTIIKEATEENEGSIKYSCQRCGTEKTEVIEKKQHIHSLDMINRAEATCEKDGNIKHWICNKCKKLYEDSNADKEITKKDIVINALGHKVEAIPAIAPSCTKPGKTEGKNCSVCGKVLVKQDTISALGHDLEKTEFKAAKCMKDGSNEYWSCNRCHKYFSDKDGNKEIEKDSWVLKKKGHRWDNGKVTKEPTCTNRGEKTFTCDECNATKTENVDALGHDYGAWTKLNDDQHQRTCSRDSNHIEGKEHSWDAGVVSKEATTKETGVRTFKCTVCNAKRTESIPVKETIKPAANQTPTAESESESRSEPGSDPNQMGIDGTALGNGASAAAADKAITYSNNEEDPAGSVYSILRLKSTKQKTNSIILNWSKVKGAVENVIYGNECGKKNKMKRLATIGTKKTFTVKKIDKNLKKGAYYKFMIVALDSNKNVVSASKVIYVATKSGKVTNPKKVVIKKGKKTISKLRVKTGKTIKVKSIITKVGKKLLLKKRRSIMYESTNDKIAKVDIKNGKIRAVGKGTCSIYAYAQNGIAKAIKMIVK